MTGKLHTIHPSESQSFSSEEYLLYRTTSLSGLFCITGNTCFRSLLFLLIAVTILCRLQYLPALYSFCQFCVGRLVHTVKLKTSEIDIYGYGHAKHFQECKKAVVS